MQDKEGYCVMSQTISGEELVWRTGEGDEALPQVFQTEREAQLEYIDDLEEDIRQFKAGEREWEEIHWPDQYWIRPIEIVDGQITVWEADGGHPVLEISIEQWRASL